MQNFIFISPNFPTNYWQFCRELKNNGMNVLGIGDQPYDELKPELKDSLNEYYKVGSLENYDEVYRAVAFFAFKYGRIDWLESNNEYWLERDAALRTDFHITSGFQTSDMPRIKYKSKMKEYYRKAGIATARYHMVDDYEGCRKFIAGPSGPRGYGGWSGTGRTPPHPGSPYLAGRCYFHRHSSCGEGLYSRVRGAVINNSQTLLSLSILAIIA